MEQFPLCLIGERVTSSPSRVMQEAALAASGRAGSYDLVSVSAAELPAVLDELRAGRWRGANVTMPHKRAVAAACDELEGDARLAGAVNTVTVGPGGRLTGDNTDARGFELALRRRGLWPAPGSSALVIGAGGAAAAVTLALSRVPGSRVTVVARRLTAARELADALTAACPGSAVTAVTWGGDELNRLVRSADIVVNATPVGLAAMPFTPAQLRSSCTVADVRHRPRPVDVVEAAARAGLRSCDGLEMLLQQGMLSFRRWTRDDPPYAAARHALEEAVGA